MDKHIQQWIASRMPYNPEYQIARKFFPDLRLTRIFECSDTPFKIKYINDKGEPILVLKDPPREAVRWLE
jgi:hypothetical protein